MTTPVNWASVIAGLETGLATVEQLAPLAALGGPQAAAIGALAASAAGVAESLLAHATDAQTVIQSSDLAQIQTITAALQAQNNQLSIQIAGS